MDFLWPDLNGKHLYDKWFQEENETNLFCGRTVATLFFNNIRFRSKPIITFTVAVVLNPYPVIINHRNKLFQ